MRTRLIIARHGNTFAPGEMVRRVGVTDLPLTEGGLKQGFELGIYLKHHQLMPDVIFTSSLQRTQQTAELAQQAMNSHLQPQVLAMFNEIDYGPDENQPEEQVIARIGQTALSAWEKEALVPTGWHVDPANLINNWQNFADTLEQDYPGKTCLVVTSNGIARFSPHLTGNFSTFCAQHRIKIATGALCVFEKDRSDDKWQCMAWNIKP